MTSRPSYRVPRTSLHGKLTILISPAVPQRGSGYTCCQTRYDVSTPLTSGDTSLVLIGRLAAKTKTDYQFNQDFFDGVNQLNGGHICTLSCHQVASFMTSHLRQKLPPSSRVRYNPIILLIYIAPDISTLFEPCGPDFTADERTRDRTAIRQLLSSQFPILLQPKIPWWRKKPGQYVRVREKSGDMAKMNQQGEKETRLAEVDPHSLSSTTSSTLARQCQPRVAKVLLPVHGLY